MWEGAGAAQLAVQEGHLPPPTSFSVYLLQGPESHVSDHVLTPAALTSMGGHAPSGDLGQGAGACARPDISRPAWLRGPSCNLNRPHHTRLLTVEETQDNCNKKWPFGKEQEKQQHLAVTCPVGARSPAGRDLLS